MKFEEVAKNSNKPNGELINLIEDFLLSGIEIAEIKDYSDKYINAESLYISIKSVCSGKFKGKAKVSRCAERVFIERIGGSKK